MEVRDETDRTGLRIAIELKEKMLIVNQLRIIYTKILIFKFLIILTWLLLAMVDLN